MQATVHECRFPLWAVKVSDFLEMTGPPLAHHMLQEKGLLHEWYPGMFLIFVSHQWLSVSHPDTQGQQVKVLQEALVNMINGSLHVHEDLLTWTDEKGLSPKMRQHISEGYIFFDYFAIPQITARKDGVNEESTKSDAALAVQSIPAYVELSNVFVALVPELTHNDTAQPVNHASWLSRGWCRAELWCRLLSNKVDTSIIVVYSATEAEFMSPLEWQNNTIVEGDFTVEADRLVVVRLGEMAVESKIRHLQANGPLNHFRFYAALRPKLFCQKPRSRSLEDFLQDFRFESLADAVHPVPSRDSGMTAVMCAALSGDENMLRILAKGGADVGHTLSGLSDLGYYDTQTVLMAATKSKQEPSVLATLVQLRADINATARTGLYALFMCRSPEHVRVLLECRAEMSDSALSGAAMFGGPDTVQLLLACRCNPAAARESSPLHALTMNARPNRKAVEIAEMLIASNADVNARDIIPDDMLWDCRCSTA